MAASVGSLSLPAEATLSPVDKASVGDPFRRMLGDFLAAHLNANLQDAWLSIGGGSQVVERVETNNPDDNTFVTSKLPCICVFEHEAEHRFERKADDLWIRERELMVLWILPPAVQIHKARRESFKSAVAGAIMHAIMLERTPTYVATGDTDALASTRGTNIFSFGGIPYQVRNVSSGKTDLKIEISGDGENGEGTKTYHYDASHVNLTITEQVFDDGSAWRSPSKLNATVATNGGSSVVIQRDVV